MEKGEHMVYAPLEYFDNCVSEDYSEPNASDVDREGDIRKQERALDRYCVELEKEALLQLVKT
jgi:hypothetical protein